MKALFDPVCRRLDHCCLDDIPGLEDDASPERVAAWAREQMRPTPRGSGKSASPWWATAASRRRPCPPTRWRAAGARGILLRRRPVASPAPRDAPLPRLHGHTYRVEAAADGGEALVDALREMHGTLNDRTSTVPGWSRPPVSASARTSGAFWRNGPPPARRGGAGDPEQPLRLPGRRGRRRRPMSDTPPRGTSSRRWTRPCLRRAGGRGRRLSRMFPDDTRAPRTAAAWRSSSRRRSLPPSAPSPASRLRDGPGALHSRRPVHRAALVQVLPALLPERRHLVRASGEPHARGFGGGVRPETDDRGDRLHPRGGLASTLTAVYDRDTMGPADQLRK
jgi:hypothetical protein